MDAPYYSLTVTHLTAGWTKASRHDVTPDAADRCVLVDPFNLDWSFVNEQVPGHLEPSVVTFNLWSRSADDDPQPEKGELLAIVLRIGAAGPLLLNRTYRVTEVTSDLVAGDDWPCRTQVVVADLLADLTSLPVVEPWDVAAPDRRRFRERLAWCAVVIARPIGCPTTWVDNEAEQTPFSRTWPVDQDASTFLAALANSHQPAGAHHTVTPLYSATFPAGYETAYPDNPPPPLTGGTGTVPPVPPGPTRYLMARADRRTATVIPQPLRLVDQDGVLRAVGQPQSAATRTPALDAAWCEVPARARRGREHLTNNLDINGYELVNVFAPADYTGVRQRSGRVTRSTGDIYTHGPITRKIETHLALRDFLPTSTDETTENPLAPAALDKVGATFLSDPTALSATWSFDAFTVYADLMPQADAEAILPKLMPAYPGEQGDDQVLRHVTVHGIEPGVRFGGLPVHGFMTSGSLSIAAGEMTYTVTTAPGRPTGAGTEDPLTVADVQAAAYSDAPVGTVAHNITIADLDYIGA